MQQLVSDGHFVFKILKEFMVEYSMGVWQMISELVFPLACELHYLERFGDLQELSHNAWDLELF